MKGYKSLDYADIRIGHHFEVKDVARRFTLL
jgi:hypothetical protein